MPDDLLARVERCYDAIPRYLCDAEAVGALVVFVPRAPGWAYYVRPGVQGGPVSASDVRAARVRRKQLGLDESFEWVHDVAPTMRAAALEAGLDVHDHPLLALRGELRPPPLPVGVKVVEVAADHPDLARAIAVAEVGFAVPGTAAGEAGPAERDAAVDMAQAARSAVALRGGWMMMRAAFDAEGPVSVGSVQVAAGAAEVVGVATLPSARRQGLGAVVTAALADAARDAGADLVFLSADDDAVARVYERLGFERVGTACAAEPRE